MAVLSNKPDPFVKNIIKKLFPEGVMSFALGQTEMPRKPDPTVPVMIATSLGVELADTYFVGDSEVDILTAKNSGMHSVAVSWGFRDRDELVKSCPEVIIDTPAELLKYFET
jgi:phosphoglycolate phosphatase